MDNGVIALEFEMQGGDITLTRLASSAAAGGTNLVANTSTRAPMWSFGVVGEGVESVQVTSRAPCTARTLGPSSLKPAPRF